MTAEERNLLLHAANAGFFSNFNSVLNNLHYRLGRDGVTAMTVDWRSDGQTQFPYGRLEDGNVWLKFFAPLPFEDMPAATIEARGYAEPSMSGPRAYAMYKLGKRWRQIYGDLFRRYITVNPVLLARVEAIYGADMAGRYCVGVHCRHPRHAIECLHGIPSPELFIARTRRLLPKGRPWAVFLASDYEPAVTAFQAAFGDRLILQPGVTRARSAADDHVHHDQRAPAIALGEQALIDCLLLARCRTLLHVTSNLATAVGYINPQIRMVYCESRIEAALGFAWSLCHPGLRINRTLRAMLWRQQTQPS